MNPVQTKSQKTVLDAIMALLASTGRAPTMQEVADMTGKAVSTVHAHVVSLRSQGFLGSRSLLPGDGRFGKGWRAGVGYAANEAERVLVERHAENSLVKAVRAAMLDAQSLGEDK